MILRDTALQKLLNIKLQSSTIIKSKVFINVDSHTVQAQSILDES